MYTKLKGKGVTIIATTRASVSLLRYTGTVTEVSDKEIELQNTTITTLVTRASANLFGTDSTSFNTFGDNIPTVILNRDYIISCSAN